MPGWALAGMPLKSNMERKLEERPGAQRNPGKAAKVQSRYRGAASHGDGRPRTSRCLFAAVQCPFAGNYRRCSQPISDHPSRDICALVHDCVESFQTE